MIRLQKSEINRLNQLLLKYLLSNKIRDNDIQNININNNKTNNNNELIIFESVFDENNNISKNNFEVFNKDDNNLA